MHPVMPDLCNPSRGTRHTIDSALPTLLWLGVDIARIVVESAGPGWPAGVVVRQAPDAGTMLAPESRVVLSVAGVGALEALPFSLRDTDDDSPFGVDPLFALFDSPLHKLVHHLRGGGHFFTLRPDDLVSAQRWIEVVFQIDPTPWRPERWYALARLLPTLHRVAGLAQGVILALDVVFGIPACGVRMIPAIAPIDSGQRLALGTMSSRLGIDTLLCGGRASDACVELTLGPVGLRDYRTHATAEMRAERDALYALVLPAHAGGRVRERWKVGDANALLRLDDALAEAVLGVTTYLGSQTERRVA